MEPVTLTTKRFVLSAPRASDINAVFVACQDAELQRFVPVPVPYRREHAEGFALGMVPAWWREDVEYVFGIRDDADAPLMGVVAWQRAAGYVGYWLAADHRGRGVMTEALGAVIEWVFTHDVDELRWEASAGNTGSAIVAQRVGFRWTGLGPIDAVRPGEDPAGWHAVLQREHLGTVQPLSQWPVLSDA